MGRTLTILLALSLAGNVFLGGFVAGRLIGAQGARPPQDLSGDLFRWRGGAELSPAAREAFQAAFASRKDAFRGDRREARDLRRKLAGALAAPDWDKEAAGAAADALADNGCRRAAAMSELLIDAFDRLPSAERQALAEELAKRQFQRPGRSPD